MTARPLLWAPAEEDKFFTYTEPTKATRLAAAYDLYLPGKTLLLVGGQTKVYLNLLCAMPPDERAVLEMRSGLADKYNMAVRGGVIDSDYPDSWSAIIHVPTPDDIEDFRNAEGSHPHNRVYYDATAQCYYLKFSPGERIVQAVFTKVPEHDSKTATPDEVRAVIAGYGTERTGGFGTTGS